MKGDCGLGNSDGGLAGGAKRTKENETLFLRPPEVARKLNVSTKTVLRLLYEGKLKGYRIRKTWRVHKASLDEFLRKLLSAVGDDEASNEN
jgi:excisionase family DNA binding protein